jgi:hypothetical protein
MNGHPRQNNGSRTDPDIVFDLDVAPVGWCFLVMYALTCGDTVTGGNKGYELAKNDILSHFNMSSSRPQVAVMPDEAARSYADVGVVCLCPGNIVSYVDNSACFNPGLISYRKVAPSIFQDYGFAVDAFGPRKCMLSVAEGMLFFEAVPEVSHKCHFQHKEALGLSVCFSD